MGKFGTSNIENLAVGHLNTLLNSCPALESHVLTGDKKISWDGGVQVYSSQNHLKSNLKGLVPVQVKGTTNTSALNKERITYQVEVADLKNYQKNSGVIFFVVYCDGLFHQIYYNSLLPVDLDNILKKVKSQKTISIPFERFPSNNPCEIVSIFENFIYHSKKQFQRNPQIKELYLDGKIDMKNKKILTNYSMVPYDTKEEMIQYFFKYPTYAYLRDKDLNMDIVLEKIFIKKIIEERPKEIIVDGEILYDKIVYEYDRQKNEIIRFGNNIRMNLSKRTMNFKFADSLFERLKDLKFLIYEFSKHEDIKSSYFIKDDNTTITFDDLKQQLNFLIDIAKSLTQFKVTKDLMLNDLTNEEWEKLVAFVNAVLYDKPIPYGLDGDEGIGTLEFGNICLLVLCRKTDKPHYFKLQNMFEIENGSIKPEEDDILLSPYMFFLKKNRLLKVDNINFFKVYQSIINLRKSEEYDSYINMYILELIAAYDIGKNPQLLELATQLLNFLIDKTEKEECLAIYKINLLQVKKRYKKLSSKDKKDLLQLKNKFTDDLELVLCCNILLESFEEANIIFHDLSKEKQQFFIEYPIYNLWKHQ